MRNLLRTNRPLAIALAVAAAATLTLGTTACGDDDDDGDTGTTEPAATDDTTEDASGDTSTDGPTPSDEFCDALADFEAAEDGAQRNTAIGEMGEALEDAGDEVQNALDDLLTGDLEPEDYTEAAATLAEFGAAC